MPKLKTSEAKLARGKRNRKVRFDSQVNYEAWKHMGLLPASIWVCCPQAYGSVARKHSIPDTSTQRLELYVQEAGAGQSRIQDATVEQTDYVQKA